MLSQVGNVVLSFCIFSWKRLLLEKVTCSHVKVFLATLVEENLVNRFSEESFVESTDAIPRISLINDFDKISLLE